MASLHKDPRGRSPFFYAAFTLSDGRRCFRSTKEQDRKKAAEVARQWEKAADLGRSGQLNEAQARKVLNDILESAGQGAMSSTSTQDFLTRWIESKETTKAAGTARRYKNTVERFLEQLGQRAMHPLASVAPRDIELLRDGEIKAGKSAKTANMAVKTLRIVFNVARRQGLLINSPADAVDFLAENSAERDTFTKAQLTMLMEKATPEWRGMILLGGQGGLRLCDAALLTWANVDFDRKLIRFQPQKSQGGKKRELETPLLPDVEKFLLSLPVKSHESDAPLFPTLSRKKGTGANGLSNTFTRLIAAAGIENTPAGAKAMGKGRTVYKLSFHSLRHTFISDMANAGISKELRMKIVGHSSNAHDRYTHIQAHTIHAALKDVPSLNWGQTLT